MLLRGVRTTPYRDAPVSMMVRYPLSCSWRTVSAASPLTLSERTMLPTTFPSLAMNTCSRTHFTLHNSDCR